MYIEYICCIGGMLGKIFLKFSQMPNEGVFSNTFFSIANFGGPKIISNFFKFSRNTFLCIGSLGKLSQNFSKFLKISNLFSMFLWNKNTCVQGGWKFGVGGSIGWCMLGNMCFWKNVSFVLFQI